MTEHEPKLRDEGEEPAADSDEASPFGRGRRTRLLAVILVLMVAVPSLAALFRQFSDGGAGNETAPDFTIELFDGRTFSLSEHLSGDGRPLVLNFWASWCVPCREEMPDLETVARQRPEVLVLGIAVQDTEEAARSFAAEIGVTYPLGHDRDGLILDLYPILGLPTTWLIRADGTVADQWSGKLNQDVLNSLIDDLLS